MFTYVSKHFKGPQELVKRALTILGSCFFVWLVMHNKCSIAGGQASGSVVKPLGGSTTHPSSIPGWDDSDVAPLDFSQICFL
jgi:hypothetical protein